MSQEITEQRLGTAVDYLLTCVAEECSEVCKEATKGIRFGLHDKWKDNPTPHDGLVAEFYDLVGVMELLFEHGALTRPSETAVADMIERKKARVQHFMQYSAERGRLKGGDI